VRARHFRSGHGDAMPSEAIQNWDAVMTAVDAALARQAKQTSSYDVIRARLISEELIAAVELRKARLALLISDLLSLKFRPTVMQPDFIWPISPVAVTSLFGRRLHPISRTYKPHTGVDLAAAFGQEVYAASAGTVLKAEWTGGYGNHVEIQHAGNVVTRYSHLADALVEPGQMVKQGQAIGLAGNTGTSTGVHLHFELWVNGRPADPLEELMDPSRSLPVAAR
jgi:murein DD-endopeptidase MepM/ murein hydrolase activator NlpD